MRMEFLARILFNDDDQSSRLAFANRRLLLLEVLSIVQLETDG